MRDVQEMRETENIVYEAIAGFGAYRYRPSRAQITEASELPSATVGAAVDRLVDDFGFVSGDETAGYRLVGRQNGPFSAV